MEKRTTAIAFDLHKDSIPAAWLRPGAPAPEVRAIPPEPKAFRRLVRQLLAHGPACACYEAGPCGGMTPQRHLAAWGLPCEVIAPTLIPQQPGGSDQDGPPGCREAGRTLPGRRLTHRGPFIGFGPIIGFGPRPSRFVAASSTAGLQTRSGSSF
jgi:hypothetical protein